MKPTPKELSVLQLSLANVEFSEEVRIFAAATTLTEMSFRPWLWRAFEYIYALTIHAIGRDIGGITLGVSQISLRHFRDLRNLSDRQSIFASMSVRQNLSLCCELVEEVYPLETETVAEHYNGNATSFYKRRLSETYGRLRAQRA